MAQLHDNSSVRIIMPDCPSDADLTGFLNDTLPPSRADSVSTHVDGCGSCQARLDRLTEASQAARYKELSTIASPAARLGAELGPADQGAVTQIVTPGEVIRNVRSVGGLPAVPGFDILSELGRGGMGVVYKARHQKLNRLVALKMILAGGAASEKTVQRFLTEAEVLARVQHPQVVQVFEVNTYPAPDGTPIPYLAMELLEGGTLSRHLKDHGGPLPPREAAELVEGLARAVHTAHLHGVVHRDLKPANVLFPSEGASYMGRAVSEEAGISSPPSTSGLSPLAPKVTDFGLAKLTHSGGADLTHTGQIVGTPSYMAPEQASGDRTLGPAADVYALGAILYECLTGRPPFAGGEPMSVLMRVINEPATDVRSLCPDVPRDLAAVTMKCLEKNPKRRYASAGDLAEDLRRFLTSRPTQARPTTHWERVCLWVKRNPKESLLLTALVCVIATGFVIVSRAWERAERTAKLEQHAKEHAEQAQTAAEDAHEATRKALAEVERQKMIAERREARLSFAQAVDWCEDGQVEDGLNQFFRALEVTEAAAAPDLARVIRVNLAGWGAEVPPSPRMLLHPDAEPRSAAFTPDGKQLITAGRRASLHLWDANTGTRIRTYETGIVFVRPDLQSFPFWEVAVSADGKTIAAGGGDGQVWVWDIDQNAPRTAFAAAGGSGNVRSVAFAPDGTLWAADGTGGVKRWNLTTQRAIAELRPAGAEPTPVQVLVVSPDGERLFTGDRAGMVRVWDVAEKKMRREWSTNGQVEALALSPDGRQLAVTGPDARCHVFDRNTGAEVFSIDLNGAAGRGVAFSEDGQTLFTADADGLVRAWHRATHLPLGVPGRFRGEVKRLRSRPGTNEVAIPAGDSVFLYGAIRFPGRLLNSNNTRRARAADIRRDGKRVAVAAGSSVTLFDPDTGAAAGSFSLPSEVLAVRFDSARDRLLCGTDIGLEAVSLPAGTQTTGTPADAGPVREIVFTPDRAAFLTHSGLSVSRWDAAELKRTAVRGTDLGLPPGLTITALDVRPDGREALIAHGSRVRFLDPVTLADSRPGWYAEDEVLTARYLPDGQRVILGLRSNSAVLADAADGRPTIPPARHGRPVTTVTFSPDGAILLTASRSGNARFWDTASGLELAPPTRHPGAVTVAAYSPAGDRVVTGTATGQVIVWPPPPPPLAGSLGEVREQVRRWTHHAPPSHLKE